MGKWSNEIFTTNLKKYLELSNRSQKEVAEAVGVSAPTFSDWVNGHKLPRMDKIEILANYFGVQKSDLIEEKMTPEIEKDNDILSDLIVRLRVDPKFRAIVDSIYNMDAKKLDGLQQILQSLQTFAK